VLVYPQQTLCYWFEYFPILPSDYFSTDSQYSTGWRKFIVPTGINKWAKPQNTGPLIYILLNHNSAYCVPLRSSKASHTCKTGGPKWLQSGSVRLHFIQNLQTKRIFFKFSRKVSYLPQFFCHGKAQLGREVPRFCTTKKSRNLLMRSTQPHVKKSHVAVAVVGS